MAGNAQLAMAEKFCASVVTAPGQPLPAKKNQRPKPLVRLKAVGREDSLRHVSMLWLEDVAWEGFAQARPLHAVYAKLHRLLSFNGLS
jgi:hypothetical protein